ncbi:oligosaccharide flippase family protein [Oceanicola sp. 502str15]|uniref:oligosaccharide flippase family protein n=1 Tax=Oceanicola sp. 502str15 TaxID=2696061 RepID=UPI002095BA28|nr:oligosaccharide flippase family protein [Oceanicola sp. 502str15]MCO6381954.1 oligosaccharide flippase family protein [Oceanicola sp. 502str15]
MSPRPPAAPPPGHEMGRHALIILAMQVAGTALWLLYTVLLARTLPTEAFAAALYVLNVALVAVLVITMGRDQILLQTAARAWARGAPGEIRSQLAASRRQIGAATALLLAGLLAACALGLPTHATHSLPVALLTGLIAGASAQLGLGRTCLRAVGRIWQSQLGFSLVRTLVPVCGGTLVLAFGQEMTLEAALLLFLASLLLALALEALFLHRALRTGPAPQPAPDPAPAPLRSGLRLWPGEVANAVLIRAAGLVGALMLEPGAAALLLAAERIAALARFPIAAASQASAPMIAQAFGQGRGAARRTLARASLLMAAGALLGTAGTALLALPGLRLLGASYVAALPLALVLTSASLSFALFGLAQSALIWSGHHRSYSRISTVMAALTCLAIALAAARAGALGAALAWSAGLWLTNIAYTLALARHTGLATGLRAAAPVLARALGRAGAAHR